jgi:SAM-dependent methyltransferase
MVEAMTTSIPPAWTTGQPPNRFAALPTGRIGRFGGRLMRAMNRAQQQEVVDLLGDLTGVEVLEVGHGPGVLLELLAARPGVARVIGVDPSTDMRYLAVRALAWQIAQGRVDIRPGDAGATGLPDAAVGLVVSVNTVSIWPDLDAGVAELRRVLRPGGRLVLSWHGGEQPTRAQRRLVLPEEKLARIERSLRARFSSVSRTRTRHCTVFQAHP